VDVRCEEREQPVDDDRATSAVAERQRVRAESIEVVARSPKPVVTP
jgi:hypothetical protein